MKRTIPSILMILFFTLFITGCGSGGGSDSSGGSGTEDNSGPLEITNLTATAGNEKVSLSWTETGDTGRVEITWSPDGTTAQSVQAGSGTFTAMGLVLGTEYTFTVTSIDGNENVTAELTATATPYLEGVPSNAVYISTVEGLKAIDDVPDGYYVLIADIDISGENWSPLGATSATRFEGTLDGNGHVITGLTISSSSGDQAFFYQINADGTVKNLGLENVSVTTSNDGSAALAARNYGDISNCYSTGTVSGGYYTAGLVGYNWGGDISDSYSECNVEGSSFSGGLVGLAWQCTISGCHATGTVSGALAVGGLAGLVRDGCTISGCYATGDVNGTGRYVGGLVGQTADNDTTDSIYSTISDSYAIGDVSGDYYQVGGLVGQNQYCDISDCYAEGDITAANYYAGGLVGENTDSAITGCHASGTVAGDSYIGGLVGRNKDSSTDDSYDAVINDSYSTASSVSGIAYVGGLVGDNVNAAITHCYAEISGNIEGIAYVGGLAGCHANSLSLLIDAPITWSYAEIGGRVNASDIEAGGLVGELSGLSVEYCYAYAAGGVSTDGADGGVGHYSGGLVGYCENVSMASEINNCYALSDVTGTGFLGGLVGGKYLTSVNYCYATGVVSDSGNNGGLIGENYSGGISDSYFNSANTDNNFGDPVSLSDMALQTTFDGWDFVDDSNGTEDIWSIDGSTTDPINRGYPYLTDLPPAN